MTIYNFGSVNIDHVYQVPHFVAPGETLSSTHYSQVLGGKGANQSVALAKAGYDVKHVGCLSKQDQGFKQELVDYGVNCDLLETLDTPSGHAIIQVTPDAENAIVLFAGANHALSTDTIENIIEQAKPTDCVLMQNETNGLAKIIESAAEKGLTVAFNPAPMNESVNLLPLDKIDILIVNEIEASELTGKQTENDILEVFAKDWQHCTVVMTLGKQGVCLVKDGSVERCPAFSVNAVDTTAAGDTFIGYFLANYMEQASSSEALKIACAASALSVTKPGAAQSIPDLSDVKEFLE